MIDIFFIRKKTTLEQMDKFYEIFSQVFSSDIWFHEQLYHSTSENDNYIMNN